MKTLLTSATFILITSTVFCQQKEQVQKTTPPQQTQKVAPSQNRQTTGAAQNNDKTLEKKSVTQKKEVHYSTENHKKGSDTKYQYDCPKCGLVSLDPGTCPKDGTTLVPHKISSPK